MVESHSRSPRRTETTEQMQMVESPVETAAENLDTNPLTPSLMQRHQVAWFKAHLPANKCGAILANILGNNLTPDSIPSSFPSIFHHPSLHPYLKLVKFLIVVYLGMYVSREFAKRYGSTWDTELDMKEFLNHNFWDTLTGEKRLGAKRRYFPM